MSLAIHTSSTTVAPRTGTSFAPEIQLLCLCARHELDAEQRARLTALVTSPLDWADVLDAAAFHGVSAMLYHHLARHAAAHVPAEPLRHLKERALST